MSQYYFKFYYQPKSGTEKRELILLSFSGRETISELFDFELELKSDDIELDEDGVINKTCSIEIYYGNSTTPIRVIHGLINEFEDVNYFPDCTLYRARVVPRVWQLSYFETNEVYLNETIEQTLTVILEEAGFLLGQDFRFDLNRSPTYRAWPFRLQYNETHLDYLQRIIEREGIYYYFEHSHNADVMVFCDNNQSLSKIVYANEADKVTFQANSGVLIASGANTVNSIICKRHTLPKKVTLRDFNDETPSLDIRGEFVINKTGIGDINLYGLNITSPEEGQQLAETHANAYLCRQKSYIGQGDVATMLAGHTFNLQHHPRAAFNALGYLLESIEHEGANLNQYQAIHPDDHSLVNYANNFTALSSEHQFAPKRQTLAPEINGTLNAMVDTEADSGYAELDQFGRYKVKLPFDRKDRGENGGKASHWVRMMQPYSGSGEGMHFPLRKGTRVLLGFIGGDPDRPFISGTINDSGDQQSIVTGENQTNNLIKTASGNKIELEDKEGKNRIKLQTGDDSTYMHLGAPNHDGSGYVMVTGGIERRDIGGGQRVTVTTSTKDWLKTAGYSPGDIVSVVESNQSQYYKCIKQVTNDTDNGPPNGDPTSWQDHTKAMPAVNAVADTFPVYVSNTDYALGSIVTHDNKNYKLEGLESPTKNSIDWNSVKAEDWVMASEDTTQKQEVLLNTDGDKLIERNYTPEGDTPWRERQIAFFQSLGEYDEDCLIQFKKKVYRCKSGLAGLKAVSPNPKYWKEYTKNIDLFEFTHAAESIATTPLTKKQEVSGDYIINRTSGTQYTWNKGKQYNYFATGADNIAPNPSSDDKHFYFGNNWQVHSSRHKPKKSDESDESDESELDKLITDMENRELKNFFDYDSEEVSEIPWKEYLSKARVNVAQHDTFNSQNGNIYDFGGYWNYNLGNSYTENHADQEGIEINRKDDFDLADIGGPHWKNIKGDLLHLENDDDVQVEKNYGDQYVYTKGNTIEVNVGHTETRSFGNSTAVFGGLYGGEAGLDVAGVMSGVALFVATRAVYNDPIRMVAEHISPAAWNQHVKSAEVEALKAGVVTLAASTTFAIVGSISSEVYMGLKNDIFMGLSSSMFVGGSSDIFVGLKSEFFAGGSLSVSLAKSIEVNYEKKTIESPEIELSCTTYNLSCISYELKTADAFMSGNSYSWTCEEDFRVKGSQLSIAAEKQFNMTAKEQINITANNNIAIKSDKGNVSIGAGRNTVQIGGKIVKIRGGNIHLG